MSAVIVGILIAIPVAMCLWLCWGMRDCGKTRTSYKLRTTPRRSQTFGKIPEQKFGNAVEPLLQASDVPQENPIGECLADAAKETPQEATIVQYVASASQTSEYRNRETTLVDRVERQPRDYSYALQAQRAAESSYASTFAAIDFETANSRYYSACSLGVVLFENGVPVKRNLYMINPDCNFAPENVAIHGITRAQVADSPKFDALWPELVPIFQKFRVVAYSDFDAKVLRSLIRHYRLMVEDSFTLDYFDVCQYARDNIYGLTNYKLPTFAAFLNIEGLKHHDAVSDAETCGKIYAYLIGMGGQKIRASMDVPATYAQQDYIRHLGGEVPPTLSKTDASKLITELIEQQRREAEAAVAKRRRGKEESELQFMSAAMRDPGYKLTKRGAKRTQDLREFQYLVSRVIADDIIEPCEMLEIKAWLESHKVLPSDFAQTFRLISDLLKIGKSGRVDGDNMKDLYFGLLDCLNELRRRPSM